MNRLMTLAAVFGIFIGGSFEVCGQVSPASGSGALAVFGGMKFELIQKELKLTAEQQKKLMQLGMVRSGDRNAVEKQIAKIFTPEQLERLKQIHMQIDPASAIVKADVSKELELTAEQRAQIADTVQQAKEKVKDAYRGVKGAKGAKHAAKGGDKNAKIAETVEKARKEISQKVLEILTPEQRTKFEKMQGEKINLEG